MVCLAHRNSDRPDRCRTCCLGLIPFAVLLSATMIVVTGVAASLLFNVEASPRRNRSIGEPFVFFTAVVLAPLVETVLLGWSLRVLT